MGKKSQCLVHHNHDLGPQQHVGFRDVAHGAYFRITIPASDITCADTHQLINSRQQQLPDPGMSSFEAQIHGIQPLATPDHSDVSVASPSAVGNIATSSQVSLPEEAEAGAADDDCHR